MPEASKTIKMSPPDEWRRQLKVKLRRRAGPLDLEIQFTLAAGWSALFAPSGAGKTTILRMLAGLDDPDSGRILYTSETPPFEAHESCLFDSSKSVNVRPHKRAIRMLSQRPALFPHLTVRRNVLYRTSNMARNAEERQFLVDYRNSIFDLCRIHHLLSKMPSQLSGGERQRVALARTIATGCGRVLLLDEPFTGLEASLRDELIRDLRTWTAKLATPVLLVTHDLAEVFAAGAHVLKMDNGRIVASGPATQVLSGERTRLLERLTSPEKQTS